MRNLLITTAVVASMAFTAVPASAWTFSGAWNAFTNFVTGVNLNRGKTSGLSGNIIATPIYSKRGGKTIVIGWLYSNSNGVPDNYPYDNCITSCN